MRGTGVYRVVDQHGLTVHEYVVGRNELETRRHALAHAARVGGKVFYLDSAGYLTLVMGRREAAA